MYLGEPVAQIFLVDNGVMVRTVDTEARDKARKAAEKKRGNGCCMSPVDYDEFEKQLVFPDIKKATQFLTKELPGLATGLKGKAAFDDAFDEGDD